MLIIKGVVMLVEAVAALAVAQTTPPDGLAARVALYTAAAAGLAWCWGKLLLPASRVLMRTVKALEALEELPAYRKRTDRRLARVERRVHWIDNGLTAILRELGIEDKVRRTYTPPGWEQTEGMPLTTWRDADDFEEAAEDGWPE